MANIVKEREMARERERRNDSVDVALCLPLASLCPLDTVEGRSRVRRVQSWRASYGCWAA